MREIRIPPSDVVIGLLRSAETILRSELEARAPDVRFRDALSHVSDAVKALTAPPDPSGSSEPGSNDEPSPVSSTRRSRS